MVAQMDRRELDATLGTEHHFAYPSEGLVRCGHWWKLRTCYQYGMRPLLQPVAPSIDDPIELLRACHDKVRRFAGLALRLRDHLAAKGADDQAQEAAKSILRYFDMAAPLHHEDEDLDLFPALRALGDAVLTASIDELEAEHDSLGHLWRALRPWLTATATGQACETPVEVDEFATAYPRHAGREEAEIYPAAAGLSASQLRQISDAMVRRRTPAD